MLSKESVNVHGRPRWVSCRWLRRPSPSCCLGSTNVDRFPNTNVPINRLEMEMQFEALKPAIILVEPKMGENIGAAARAMKNFGLSDLRLVKPYDGWPNPLADAVASHAVDLLRSARLYDSVEDAIADLDRVYAATARTRFMTKAFVTSRQLPGDLHQLAAAAAETVRAAHVAATQAGIVSSHSPAGYSDSAVSVSSQAPPPEPAAGGWATSSSAAAAAASSKVKSSVQQQQSSPYQISPAPAAATSRITHSDARSGNEPQAPSPSPSSSCSSLPLSSSSSSSRIPPLAIRMPRAGILFGREASGLTNEEVAFANRVLAIEAQPEYPVLNLAQAVMCIAYELYNARLDAAGRASAATTTSTGGGGGGGTCSTATEGGGSSNPAARSGSGVAMAVSSADELRARAEAVHLASQGELENFLRRLVSELDGAEFFESAAKRPATLLSIRNLAAKVEGLTASEVALLHGILTKLTASARQQKSLLNAN